MVVRRKGWVTWTAWVAFCVVGREMAPSIGKPDRNPTSKADRKAALDVGAWLFNVTTSVGIIMVNKQLMANYGFSFGLYPFCWLPLLLLLLLLRLLLLPCVCVSSDHWLMLSCPCLCLRTWTCCCCSTNLSVFFFSPSDGIKSLFPDLKILAFLRIHSCTSLEDLGFFFFSLLANLLECVIVVKNLQTCFPCLVLFASLKILKDSVCMQQVEEGIVQYDCSIWGSQVLPNIFLVFGSLCFFRSSLIFSIPTWQFAMVRLSCFLTMKLHFDFYCDSRNEKNWDQT